MVIINHFPMNACKVLLTTPKNRLRCRHCHLTLQREELKTCDCPKCYEATGIKRFDFEEVVTTSEKFTYRCADCQATWSY